MTKGRKIKCSQEMQAVITKKSTKKTPIGEIVGDVLRQAKDENRLTCGLYESGLLLEMSPESVMLCVLQQNKSEDVTLDIHYTLIEAFCLENAVSLIKVDSSDKLTQLLGDRSRPSPIQEVPDCDDLYSLDHNDPDIAGSWHDGGGTDYNCLLIEFPREKASWQEEELLHYHKSTCLDVPQPIIELAV